MDGQGRLLRPLKAERHDLSRSARIAQSRRRLTRFRRTLSKHSWIVPATRAGVLGFVLGTLIFSGVLDYLGRLSVNQVERLSVHVGLTINAITVSGQRELSEDDILEALSIDVGTVLWRADLSAAHDRIAALPWVKDVSLARTADGHLTVSLTEKRPFARWQSNSKFFALDEAGEVITQVDAERHLGLFHVVHDGAPEAMPRLFGQLTKHPEIASRVRSAVFVGARRWNLHFDNQVLAQLPEGDFSGALTLLEQLVRDEGLMEKSFQVVDLRDPARVHLRGVPPQAEKDRLGDAI